MLRRLIAAASAILFALLGSAYFSRGQSETPKRPNLILLYADDLGYGDLGSFGHPTIQTPNLDRLGAEGIKLTSFYAAPSCTPSRAALLTGRYPIRSGLSRVLGPESENGIPASEITIGEALKSRGYRTAAIGKWHLGTREQFLPTSNGFDEYFGLLYSNDMQPPWVQTDRPLELYRNTEAIESPVDQSTLTKRYTQEAIRFIQEAKDEPFFLYLAYTMVHVPLFASEDFSGRSRAGLYGDTVEEIDWSAGRILETLRQEALDRETLVVFTSDNGPWLHMPERMLREGGITVNQPWDAGSTGPLRGWKGSTYEGGVRVPFLARWPGRIPRGQESAEIASVMDLYVTLLSLAGAQVPSDRPVDGRDIFPLLEGKAKTLSNSTYFYFRGEVLEGVREGEWKFRLSNHLRDTPRWELRLPSPLPRLPDDVAPEPELYHLEIDPYEMYNRAAEHPEIVSRLKAAMEGLARETGAQMH